MRHPKIRTAVKWVCTVVAVILLTVWIVSGWFGVLWKGHGAGYAAVNCGAVEVMGGPNGLDVRPGWHAGWGGGPWVWSIGWERSLRSWSLRVPLWVVTVPLLVMVDLVWRRDALARRRARAGQCLSCGYDRSGLGRDVKCPECAANPM